MSVHLISTLFGDQNPEERGELAERGGNCIYFYEASNQIIYSQIAAGRGRHERYNASKIMLDLVEKCAAE